MPLVVTVSSRSTSPRKVSASYNWPLSFCLCDALQDFGVAGHQPGAAPSNDGWWMPGLELRSIPSDMSVMSISR
jgi:hypothetical protein